MIFSLLNSTKFLITEYFVLVIICETVKNAKKEMLPKFFTIPIFIPLVGSEFWIRF